MRVVIYVRISKDRVDQTSTFTQEQEAKAFCDFKGWTVVEVCKDEGRSAYKRNVKRPAFNRAMRLVEAKQADVFMVWKLDRFYRGLDEFNKAWNRIREAGGNLVSVTEPSYDTTSNDPIIRWAIMGFAAMAEQESRTKADRSRSAHRKRRADKKVPNGPRSFGYDKPSPNVFTLNPDESAFIKNAATRVLNGESLRSVLRSYPNMIGTQGKPLTVRGMSAALTAPRTAGLLRDPESERLIEGEWEPILDRETWNALVAMFDDPERRTSTNHGVSHVLSGIMECGKPTCDDVMGSRSWKNGFRYQCRTCGNSIDEAVADNVVRSKVLELCPQSEWESLLTQGTGTNPDVVVALEERINELEIDQLMELDSRKRSNMQTAIDRLTDQLTEATEGEWLDLPNIKNLADDWDAMTLDEVRSVIKLIVARITLAPVKGATTNPMIRVSVEGK